MVLQTIDSMVNARRVTRRLSRDGRLGIGFLQRAGIDNSLVYTAHESNGALRLKPFDPRVSSGKNAHKASAMFYWHDQETGNYDRGDSRDQIRGLAIPNRVQPKRTEDEHVRKLKTETEKLRKRVGLKSKDARNVIIEYNLISIVIRAL